MTKYVLKSQMINLSKNAVADARCRILGYLVFVLLFGSCAQSRSANRASDPVAAAEDFFEKELRAHTKWTEELLNVSHAWLFGRGKHFGIELGKAQLKPAPLSSGAVQVTIPFWYQGKDSRGSEIKGSSEVHVTVLQPKGESCKVSGYAIEFKQELTTFDQIRAWGKWTLLSYLIIVPLFLLSSALDGFGVVVGTIGGLLAVCFCLFFANICFGGSFLEWGLAMAAYIIGLSAIVSTILAVFR